MATLKALREARGKAVADMRAILDTAEADKRDLTADEQKKYDDLFAEQERTAKKIEREERQAELDREAAEQALKAKDQKRGGADDGKQKSVQDLQMVAFRNYLRTGTIMGEGVEELRALQADSDVEGGYLVAPEQFVQQLIKNVDNMVFIRNLATKFQVATADSLGVPTLDTDPDDATWTSELATGAEDTATRFGKRALHPHPVAKRIKISKTLLRKAMMQPEALVLSRIAYKFGITQEKAFLTGTGVQQPLGIYTASNDGITTSRDVSTGNTTTSVTFDGLIEAKYTLKGQYWSKARWNFHRDALKQISKLKDGEGQYIWRQSVREGEPDRILNFAFDMSEYTPNTFTTGLYVGCLGDFSNYWIADALDMQVQRLVELYAETNQDGFIGRMETDGAPVLAEAFVRVKLA